MKFTTVTDPNTFYPSHLVGYVTSTRRALEERFGKPFTYSQYDSDGKVTTEWILEFEDGVVATIYDWKRYSYGSPALDEDYKWHIGGLEDKATPYVLEALEAVNA